MAFFQAGTERASSNGTSEGKRQFNFSDVVIGRTRITNAFLSERRMRTR